MSSQVDNVSPIKITQSTKIKKYKSNCVLTRQFKETLWSIASRYKEAWHVDVFSAMIAIHRSNITKFSQRHIGLLMDNRTLSCPSKENIATMGTKAQMKAEFHRLNAQILK